MIFPAPAKINLFLKITGRDPKDGYHFINSVFAPVSLYDILDIEPTDDPAIKINDAFGKLKIKQEDNLAYAAAALLKKYGRIRRGAKITIYKYIPHGAGLGGGSSDAAAVLKALNRLWGVDLPLNKLKKLAFKLGSDIPFFISCKPAFVSGKGEKIRVLKRLRRLWYLIVVKKGIKVPTPEAYKWYDRDLRLTLGRKNTIITKRLMRGFFPSITAKLLYNDFERPVFKRITGLKKVKKAMLRLKGEFGVSLSGSGAAIFALFEKKDQAVACSKKAEKLFKGSFICLAHSI